MESTRSRSEIYDQNPENLKENGVRTESSTESEDKDEEESSDEATGSEGSSSRSDDTTSTSLPDDKSQEDTDHRSNTVESGEESEMEEYNNSMSNLPPIQKSVIRHAIDDAVVKSEKAYKGETFDKPTLCCSRGLRY